MRACLCVLCVRERERESTKTKCVSERGCVSERVCVSVRDREREGEKRRSRHGPKFLIDRKTDSSKKLFRPFFKFAQFFWV